MEFKLILKFYLTLILQRQISVKNKTDYENI